MATFTAVCLSLIATVALLSSVVTGSEEVNQGCCLPTKFSAQAIISVNRLFQSSFAIADVDYDFEGKKSSVKQTIYHRGTAKKNVTILEDYNTKKRYIVVNQETCFVSTIEKEMRDECILKNATFMGSGYYGGDDETLDYKQFMIRRSKKGPLGFKVNQECHVTVTKKNCIPIRETFISKIHFLKITSRVAFINLVTEIKDSDVFEVPDVCVEDKATQAPPSMYFARAPASEQISEEAEMALSFATV